MTKKIVHITTNQINQQKKKCSRNVSMSSLEYKQSYGHVYKERNGLTIVVITDAEYPTRAAHGIIRTVMRQWELDVKLETWSSAGDFEVSFPKLATFIKNFESPKPDKIEEVQKEIENAKEIIVQSIEKVLENMDKLDELVEKSNDLSQTSRMFYKNSKKMNRCCSIL
ncbi:hypothetical protein RFI_14548 [Reticulomyxa filosa]|uniref:V-SNARE coiled-coil homology domain-containing protein n=1 Tax=Reticulomyxa filosa TaxID=46433 RepID=X6N9A9_RETFI|nr:hypothetical protein RFI_14548 [Reticulomyxa filosa]|eukprot:ETO22646.1 hypothetical protein RFI_14548 [Reticulomyxa filosa]